ncbi:unnamed protein product, partial [Brassica oleracea]
MDGTLCSIFWKKKITQLMNLLTEDINMRVSKEVMFF